MTEETTVQVQAANGEKKECPICHLQVSAKAGPFARHMMKHAEKATPIQSQADAAPVNKVLGKIKAIDFAAISNVEVRKHMERAAAVQNELRKAPEVFIGAMTDNASKTLVAAYAPECVARYDTVGRPLHTHTPYWGDSRLITADIAKGYEPVLNEQSEFVRNHGGDILYRIPRQISQARIRKSEQASELRLSRATKIAAQPQTFDDKGKPIAMPDADMSGLKEEAFGKVSEMTFNSNEGLG